MVQFNEEEQHARILALKRKEGEESANRLAQKYKLPYTDLNVRAINTNALRLIPEEAARAHKLAVFEKVDQNIEAAILSPANQETQNTLEDLKKRGFKIKIFIVSEASLEKAWKLYGDISKAEKSRTGGFTISDKRIEELTKKFSVIEDVQKEFRDLLETSAEQRNTTAIMEVMMAGALSMDASDIHLEPQTDDIRLRYRIDGALMDIALMDKSVYRPMLSRLKLLSGLKLNITSEAQDGRFGISYGKLEIDIRSSVIPGGYGESVVMRILNPESIAVPLEDLGMYPQFLKMLEAEIKKPNGMILTTGPTGSGKTTTLYASLKKIYNPEKKILTIENPIEYHLEGIVQTQVDKARGYTFASGLRSALRQDPDVIMVGEIRDQETAETAINAALTGHLVFSTLHTNNSAGTFARLIDLGVNPKVISSSLNLSMAQRLIRKLCPHCKQEKKLAGEERSKIETVLKTIPKSYIDGLQTETIYTPSGCSKCNNIGYKGRLGLFEGVLTTKEIERVVINSPSEREIMAAAEGQGLLFMPQDGVIKILQGETSIGEVETTVSLTPEA